MTEEEVDRGSSRRRSRSARRRRRRSQSPGRRRSRYDSDSSDLSDGRTHRQERSSRRRLRSRSRSRSSHRRSRSRRRSLSRALEDDVDSQRLSDKTKKNKKKDKNDKKSKSKKKLKDKKPKKHKRHRDSDSGSDSEATILRHQLAEVRDRIQALHDRLGLEAVAGREAPPLLVSGPQPAPALSRQSALEAPDSGPTTGSAKLEPKPEPKPEGGPERIQSRGEQAAAMETRELPFAMTLEESLAHSRALRERWARGDARDLPSTSQQVIACKHCGGSHWSLSCPNQGQQAVAQAGVGLGGGYKPPEQWVCLKCENVNAGKARSMDSCRKCGALYRA